MNRWLIGSALAIAVGPVSVTSASPDTRPAPGPTTRSIPDLNQFHFFDFAPEKDFQQWKGLPDFGEDVVPSFVVPPTQVKPHGPSFQFNGLTVYVEPV
jgi:hypothetical protein